MPASHPSFPFTYSSVRQSDCNCIETLRKSIPRRSDKPLVLKSSIRPLIALSVTAILLASSLSPAIAGQAVREAVTRSRAATGDAWTTFAGWVRPKGSSQGRSDNGGIRPRNPESKAERVSRAARLEINPRDGVVLQSRQPMLFTAIPLDREGEPINGLQAEWESSDKQVIFIRKNGQAIAGKPGRASLTAKVGSLSESVRIIVSEGSKENFGGTKKTDSTRGGRARVQNFSEPTIPRASIQNALLTKRNHSGKLESDQPGDQVKSTEAFAARLLTPLPQRPPNEDPLPDNETNSLYQASNATGSPFGKTKPGALTPSVATEGTENGNQNFTFGLPIVGLSGRGLGVSLSLVYNSQVWNKSTDPGDSSTQMTYDVDSGWPAPGFRLGLGQIEDQGSYGFTLTDSDGTRHELVYSSASNYDTSDGTFIHYYGGSSWGYLYYPNGTVVQYGAGGGGYRLYPTQVTDRNGNYILISYAGTSGAGPKISSIQDTLGRYVYFYYASNGDLVTITAPGLTGQSARQVMRFYYTDVSIGTGLFDSSISVTAPTSVHALQYVYFGASSDGSSPQNLGLKFDYSLYGMMTQTTQYRGMTVSSTSTSSAGSVSANGTLAAQTLYNYPTTAQMLTDVPKYSTRTDEWAGRTTSGSAPVYTFANSTATGKKISTVTAPDGTITETQTIDNSGSWNDGLVSDTYVQYGSTPTVLAHSHMDWEQDSSNNNIRVSQMLSTDVPAGLTRATVYSYTSYNNISAVSERDFTTNGTVSSTELRRTELTYVTSSNYINHHQLHLVSMVKVFPGGSSTPAARVDYAYDDYGTSYANLIARDDIIMHDPAYDPFQTTQETNCHWECWEWEGHYCYDWEWVCDYYNPFDSATDYRGNVTSVTTYPDATTTSGAITHSTTYDIAGNVMTAQVDCCQTKSFTYSGAGSTGNHDYAYVISTASGNPSGVHLTTTASYDYNTGLPATITDANSQDTEYSYNPASLRLNSVDFVDGGQVSVTYSDGLSADADGKYHYYVESATKLDSSHNVLSRSYFDGRGATTRSMSNQTSTNGWRTQDVQYDNLGRAFSFSNPYYASAYSSTPASSSSMYWTTTTFDHLGRATVVTMPTGDSSNTSTTTIQSSYDGVFTTVTDPANKTRRQKVDALGRVIRLDEPTSSGLGTTSAPNQPTSYYYDALDNLVHINQPGPSSINQDRYFKYDSLSRLIRERQVEQITNSSYNLSDSLTGNSSWTRKLEYNSSGLVTNSYDARGVSSTVSYDDLNRVTQISYSDSTHTAHYYYDSQTLPSGAPSTSSPDSYSRGYSAGRLVAMTYGSGATGNYFGYDVRGRVNMQFQVTGSTPTKYKLSYAYNYAGLLTGETYPTGRVLSYSYDEGGRLSSLGDGTTTFANAFAYAPHGGLTSETWGNSAVHTLDYNKRLQPSQVKLALSSTTLQQYDYGYGGFNTSSGAIDTTKNNGQIGKVTGTIGTTAQWNQGFTYDELSRLSNVTEHQGSAMTTQTYSQGYTYDNYGNRRQSANATLGLQAISSSEIDSATNRFIATGLTPTTYDAAGNITQDTKFRGMNYTYDANGRMLTAQRTDNTNNQTSVYDCAGQRVKTSANNVTRTMVYDIFGQLVAEYLGSSGATLQRENIYRGGELLAVYEPGVTCKSISDFVTAFYSGVLHRSPTTTEFNAAVATLTQAQSQGLGQLMAAAQHLGKDLFLSDEYTNSKTDDTQFVTDLYWGFLQRAPDTSGLNFWVGTINNGNSWANVRQAFAVSSEFQELVASLCTTTASGSASLKYALSDAQGATRAVMNNNGSSSAIIARHDYLPFGEEIWAGIGSRSTTQMYGATDAIRQKYGLTERDDATGLDHTWWREYESFSGRWTSPDPYNGSMSIGDPQSFNRFSYTQNDPVNLVDPSGLATCHRADGTPFWCTDEDKRILDGAPIVSTYTISSLFGGYFLPASQGGHSSDYWGFMGTPTTEALPAVPTPTNPTSTKSDCRKTVEDLVNRVRYQQLSAQATAVTAGRYMAWDAVNGRFRHGHDNRNLGTTGFQAGLTANGQGADVYKHIYGVAGGILIGDRTVGIIPGLPGRAGMTGNENVNAQINEDRASASNGRLESYAELADDYAGEAVGRDMLDRVNGQMSNLQLSDALFHQLCSY
jgi:RHS repeat-associated protein